MSSSIELPICSCCSRHIIPNDKSIKFDCPKSDKGKIIYEISNPKAYDLVQLEGNFVLKNLGSVKEFIYQNPKLKPQITKIIIKDNGRWDLVTKNGVLFKLPLKNKQNATNEINKYVSLKNVEIVDLRFLKKKIYVKIKQNKKYALTKEKE